jgi:multidrug efflux pump subunit AcrB
VNKVRRSLRENIPALDDMLPPLQAQGRVRPQFDIEAEVFAILASVPDIRAYKLNDRGERDISFNVLSDDDDKLNKAVAMLESRLRNEDVLEYVSSSGALPRPELQIVPKIEQAARLGVTTQRIAETVRVATIGDTDAALAKLSADGRLIPVRVQIDRDMRSDAARITSLRVPTASGGSDSQSVVKPTMSRKKIVRKVDSARGSTLPSVERRSMASIAPSER